MRLCNSIKELVNIPADSMQVVAVLDIQPGRCLGGPLGGAAGQPYLFYG